MVSIICKLLKTLCIMNFQCTSFINIMVILSTDSEKSTACSSKPDSAKLGMFIFWTNGSRLVLKRPWIKKTLKNSLNSIQTWEGREKFKISRSESGLNVDGSCVLLLKRLQFVKEKRPFIVLDTGCRKPVWTRILNHMEPNSPMLSVFIRDSFGWAVIDFVLLLSCSETSGRDFACTFVLLFLQIVCAV